MQLESTTPVEADDIKPCALCGNGLARTGTPVFYEISIASCVVDVNVARQLHGMELMMGSLAVARAMAPSTAIAQRLQPSRHFICTSCATSRQILPIQLLEG